MAPAVTGAPHRAAPRRASSPALATRRLGSSRPSAAPISRAEDPRRGFEHGSFTLILSIHGRNRHESIASVLDTGAPRSLLPLPRKPRAAQRARFNKGQPPGAAAGPSGGPMGAWRGNRVGFGARKKSISWRSDLLPRCFPASRPPSPPPPHPTPVQYLFSLVAEAYRHRLPFTPRASCFRSFLCRNRPD